MTTENTNPTTAEAPATTPATPAPAVATPDPAFAALAAKERELRQAQESFKKDRDAYMASVSEDKKGLEAWKKATANAKRDPLGYLKAAGIEYDQVSQAVLNDGKPSADLIALDVESKLEAAKAEWKAEMEAERKRLSDERAASESAVVERWARQTTDWVKSEGEKYELVNLYDLGGQIPQAIQKAWDDNQEELTREAAAERLENHLREQVRGLKKTKFWSELLKEPAATDAKSDTGKPAVSEKQPAPRVEQRVKAPTLTNDVNAMPSTIPEGLSPQQKWEALKKAKGLT